jgi:hypothetical protein
MLDNVRGTIEAIPADERWGSLCLFGEWFGGRPYENQHTFTAVRVDDQAVVLNFDDGETLTVWNPAGVSVTEDGLRIAERLASDWNGSTTDEPRRRRTATRSIIGSIAMVGSASRTQPTGTSLTIGPIFRWTPSRSSRLSANRVVVTSGVIRAH